VYRLQQEVADRKRVTVPIHLDHIVTVTCINHSITTTITTIITDSRHIRDSSLTVSMRGSSIALKAMHCDTWIYFALQSIPSCHSQRPVLQRLQTM
jgi:CCR4-NOT transcriptional regulation complex NOT5 subunit